MINFSRIETYPETSVIGMSCKMSLINNLTSTVWQSFMKERSLVKNRVSDEFLSIQIYPLGYFEKFNPETVFTKWAGVAVSEETDVPHDMQAYRIPKGLYAVFNYKGLSSDAHHAFRFIFEEWVPQSGYIVDARPHFEVIGKNLSSIIIYGLER